MPSTAGDIRLLIVADDPLARAGLAMLLGEQPDFEVIGQIAAGPDWPAQIDFYRPEAVLWDLGWEPMFGTHEGALPHPGSAYLAELKEMALPIVVLLPDEGYAAQLWSAGAGGVLLRETPIERLAMALRAVVEGLIVIDPAFVQTLAVAKPPPSIPLAEELTARELQVLQLLAEGMPNKTIARRLEISDHTVKFHVTAIMTKLGAQSRTEAVVRASRLGLILL